MLTVGAISATLDTLVTIASWCQLLSNLCRTYRTLSSYGTLPSPTWLLAGVIDTISAGSGDRDGNADIVAASSVPLRFKVAVQLFFEMYIDS
jgi:hypothetical protein